MFLYCCFWKLKDSPLYPFIDDETHFADAADAFDATGQLPAVELEAAAPVDEDVVVAISSVQPPYALEVQPP